MKIKTKMLLGGAFLAAIPVLVGSFFISHYAINRARSALEASAKDSLIAIRDITIQEISSYIEGVENQAVSLSENLMIVEAMTNFSLGFNGHSARRTDDKIQTQRASVEAYYKEQFLSKYTKLNHSVDIDVTALTTPLDKQSIALQYDFISNNEHPLGSKHLLERPLGISSYAQSHEKYHRVFRNFIERFGYYDLFLVDHNTGDIVYSVFKGLDYTTSLIDGPYANSGIGQAFALANSADDRNFTALTDFAPYLPSYNAPASFIATPIYLNDTKIGILILQMPIDKINEVMTHKQKWEETGLGKTGETYIVGSDYTMRSNDRLLVEDQENYLNLIQDIGLDQNIIKSIKHKGTSIGLKPVKTEGTTRALAGKSGFAIFDDYRGVTVLSAYKPLNIAGLKWAIMSEIDESEAFAPIHALQEKINMTVTLVMIAALIFGPFIAWLASQTILNPIKNIVTAVKDLSEGEGDLTKRITSNTRDEIGELAHYINQFVTHLDQTFSNLIKSAMRLIPMSEELSEGNIVITDAANVQNQHISLVRERLYSAQNSTEEVNNESAVIMDECNNSVNTVNEGMRIFDLTCQKVEELTNIINNASDSIDTLKSESDNIVSVIDVISGVAEQTNLLALNAAIEAARAGDAGRGFAVVADEVRALASRTHTATQEVSDMINAIQSGTDKVVNNMSLGLESTEACNTHVNDAKDKLTSIDDAMKVINEKVSLIHDAVGLQKASFGSVAVDFHELDESFNNSLAASQVTVQIGEDMSKMSAKLHGMVDHFTLTDNNWSTAKRNKVRLDACDDTELF